jgi:hypothetical protein
MPPSCPFVVQLLRHPLVVSFHRLVVVSPLVVPPSRRPLATPLSRRLAPAGCCINSCRATLSSSHRATSLSSCLPITELTSCHLIAPAGCCIASRCTALSSSSHCAALSLSCSGWQLRQLSSLHPLVLSSCCSLVLSLRAGWLLRGLHQTMPPPPAIERTSHHRHRHRRHYCHCCCHHHHHHHRHRHHHHRYHRCQTCHRQLLKKEATAAAPPAYQRQHQGVSVYKSGLI